MNTCDNVNKVISIPMLAMCAVAGVADFQMVTYAGESAW